MIDNDLEGFVWTHPRRLGIAHHHQVRDHTNQIGCMASLAAEVAL